MTEHAGDYLYSFGDEKTRDWFERQWRIWPKRADEQLTTNLTLHYSAVQAYRRIHGIEPRMSRDFRVNVAQLDKLSGVEPAPPEPVEHVVSDKPLSKRRARRLRGKK